ncbi:SH3 domain-containing protein [Myxococcus sp. RHSTA-1-4]|uniref:SH3 domain-containing protein n=1 Tax=Myxococcus sp. RHSTA-1-4 TaxID=2874601 RepID=UPI001CC0952E|nr:SH3 domain-containing protein [Myxococcus sp. RHSTA-1-4]MBZ4421290.1 SH3 domain-containing protein [Myxococcus sp. RHSTA-1-4]
MIRFTRSPPPPPPPPRQAPAPVQSRPAAPSPATSQFEPTSQARGQPNLTLASNLHTERLGDGRTNCLEQAMGLARPGDSIILMNDSRDGVGHALVCRPDGSVVDPNHPEVRYETLGQWQALHPQYSQPVSVPATQVRQVLSLPPGEQREALIRQLGLSGVAGRQVADDDARWVTPREGVNIRNAPGTEGTRVIDGQNVGDRMQVIGQNEDGTWLNVELEDGTQGWVFAELVTDTEAPPPPPPPRFEDWLVNGTRPPDLDIPIWNALGPEGQQRLIQAEREKAVAEAWPPPDFDPNGPPPPSIDARTWHHLPPEDRQAIFHEQWQAAVREQTALLFNGVPEGGVAAESPFLGADSDLGRGQVGQWSRYAVQEGAAAQYFNLQTVFGEGWPATHYNLCGPLAVGASLGLTPQQALTLFKDSNGDVSESRLKGRGTTNNADLEKMYEAAGWTAEYTAGQMTRPEDMARLLAEGQQLVALVNIDTSGSVDGMLRDFDDSTKQVAHWVNVRAVEQDASGEWMVRVYNPFQNREEVYSWEDFEASWNKTGGTNEDGTNWFNRSYGLLVATPPEE